MGPTTGPGVGRMFGANTDAVIICQFIAYLRATYGCLIKPVQRMFIEVGYN